MAAVVAIALTGCSKGDQMRTDPTSHSSVPATTAAARVPYPAADAAYRELLDGLVVAMAGPAAAGTVPDVVVQDCKPDGQRATYRVPAPSSGWQNAFQGARSDTHARDALLRAHGFAATSTPGTAERSDGARVVIDAQAITIHGACHLAGPVGDVRI